MKQVISLDQKAFIAGRNIGENILDVYALIEESEDSKEEDLLIFLDIEKAYDTVKWRFLTTVLQNLGFPDTFIHWIEVLYKNKEIRFYNNGHSSDPVFPSKGLAQGCGLSPLLFIVVMSRLNVVINNNHNLQGIHCGDSEKKCCMAADDTVISLQGHQKNLSELEVVLKSFYSISGLKVNFHKSKIMKIGSWKKIPVNWTQWKIICGLNQMKRCGILVLMSQHLLMS